jgi:hypothetical protein
MVTVIVGIVLVLHGLTHLWYVVLAQRLVAFRPEMGWTGQSWALTSTLGEPVTRAVATATYLLVAATFALGGVSVLTHAAWSRPLLAGSATLSLAAIVLFWDGGTDHLVEKGLIGLAINVAVLLWVFPS